MLITVDTFDGTGIQVSGLLNGNLVWAFGSASDPPTGNIVTSGDIALVPGLNSITYFATANFGTVDVTDAFTVELL